MLRFRCTRSLAVPGLLALVGAAAAPAARADEQVKVEVKKVVKDCDGEDCDGEDCDESSHRVIVIGDDGEVKNLHGHDFDWHGEPGSHFAWRTHGKGGFLGISITDLTPELRRHFGVPEDSGVLVSRVVDDSAAAAAGVVVGDILTAVDGEALTSSSALMRRIGAREPGAALTLEVWRDGSMQSLGATLGERPDHGRHARRIMVRCGDGDEDCKGGAMILGPEFDCGGAEDCVVNIECDDGDCECVVNGEASDCASLPGFHAPGK